VSVEFSGDRICSGAKEMPAHGKKVEPSMCLGCWNSAVKRNSLLVICERGDVYTASC